MGPDGIADFTHLNIPVVKNISYGEHPAQKLNIYPAQQNRTNSLPKRPAVVFFHGGFWQFGQYDETSIQTICSHLAARGITAISASYRLYPETDYNRILEDASMAVAWAYKNADKHGAAPEKVVASGWPA